MRDRNHRDLGLAGKRRAADTVTLGLARRDAGSLRENRDPDTLPQAYLAPLNDLADRMVASPPVDRDRLHGCETPAEDRYP